MIRAKQKWKMLPKYYLGKLFRSVVDDPKRVFAENLKQVPRVVAAIGEISQDSLNVSSINFVGA